jgi:hypothetical protein
MSSLVSLPCEHLKRSYDECTSSSTHEKQARKKAKIEDTRHSLTWNARHFLSNVGSTQVSCAPLRSDFWLSGAPSYSPVVLDAKNSGSGSEEEENETKSSEEEPPVFPVPVMAEVVDLPLDKDLIITNAEKLPPSEASPAMLRKLTASKSPIMEALIYCAFNSWGVEIVKQGVDKQWIPDPEFGLNSKNGVIAFKFSDFDLLSSCLERVNSKNKPTTDPGARIKALKRWFDGIPCVRNRNEQFIATVKKTEQLSKVKDMIRRMLKIYKKRLDQSKQGKEENNLCQQPSALVQGYEQPTTTTFSPIPR